jgi:polyhydroxyalkanoate synthesis regulator protein
VVRSTKDRRIDELQGIRLDLQNNMKINDWAAIQSNFEKLNKAAEKTKRQIGGYLKVYVRALAEVEEFLSKTMADKDLVKKKMSATNAKALNAMKQRIRKHNAMFQAQIDQFRADPDAYVDKMVSRGRCSI